MMILKKGFLFLTLSLVSLQTIAFCQNDEETIRTIFEKTSDQKIFSWNVTPIKEGLTNRNYKVFVNGTPYFVRLGHENPQSLRIDRVKELSLYSLAEKDGIAPKLVYSDSATGTLIAPFIQGTPYGKKGGTWLYERTESIQRIVSLLRRYHSHLAPGAQTIDYPFQIIYDYIEQARSASIPLPKDIDRTVEIVRSLKSRVDHQQKVLCHQDLVPDNFIFDGKNLYLVDWEYAEWSDPFYDFAALCTEHEYDEQEKELLLKYYFQNPTEEQRIHLEIMCMLYSLRDSLWYFIQNYQSTNKPSDYLQLANYYYQKFFTSERWLRSHHVTIKGSNSF